MRGLLASLQRIAIVSAIVIFCGASACDNHPEGEIAYAPGYGYVVQVVRYKPRTNKSYYVFPTEARAREFYGEYHSNWGPWPNVLKPGEVPYDWNNDLYDEIDRIKIPLSRWTPPPPPINEETAPLAVPDLPEPIPQIPQ